MFWGGRLFVRRCVSMTVCVWYICASCIHNWFVINRTLLGFLYRHNCPLMPTKTFKFKASYANRNIHDWSTQPGAVNSMCWGGWCEWTGICLLHLLCYIQGKRRVMYIMQLHGRIQKPKSCMFCRACSCVWTVPFLSHAYSKHLIH